MTLSRAILASTIVLAFAIVVASFSPAESQQRSNGYMIAASGNSGQFIWRVNTVTGSVSYCIRKDNSLDSDFIARRAPYCSASSPPVNE